MHPSDEHENRQKQVGLSPLISSAPIPNFRRIYPWLYRGGQPDSQGLKYLQELGIKTVVSLRWWQHVIEQERLSVQAFGLNFINIPLNYWTYPSRSDVKEFFAIVDNEVNRPIYVHCKHGSDRTGLLLAFYRMARDGWSAEQAYKEMKECGFHRWRMHHFKWAVYMFDGRF